MLVATAVNVLIFIRMCQVRQFTNFIVVHILWVQVSFATTYIITAEGLLSRSCGLDLVRTRQALLTIYTSYGIISFTARLLDREFRHIFLSIFRCPLTTLHKRLQGRHQLLRQHLEGSREIDEAVYLSVFERIQLKVTTKQFILDSLISLSFYISSQCSASVLITNSSYQENLLRDDEAFYSIRAENIKEVMKDDKFSNFFNVCEDHAVTAYKYNVVEYFPERFCPLRDSMGVSDEVLLQ
jgi:hypothetical protein